MEKLADLGRVNVLAPPGVTNAIEIATRELGRNPVVRELGRTFEAVTRAVDFDQIARTAELVRPMVPPESAIRQVLREAEERDRIIREASSSIGDRYMGDSYADQLMRDDWRVKVTEPVLPPFEPAESPMVGLLDELLTEVTALRERTDVIESGRAADQRKTADDREAQRRSTRMMIELTAISVIAAVAALLVGTLALLN